MMDVIIFHEQHLSHISNTTFAILNRSVFFFFKINEIKKWTRKQLGRDLKTP